MPFLKIKCPFEELKVHFYGTVLFILEINLFLLYGCVFILLHIRVLIC